jgi:hypothetical protein
VDAELHHEVSSVRLHRFYAQAKLLSDFLVAFSFGDELHRFAFSPGQGGRGRSAARPRGVHNAGGDPGINGSSAVTRVPRPIPESTTS